MEKNDEMFRLVAKQLKKLFKIIFVFTILFILAVLFIVHSNGALMAFNKQFQFIVENITYLLILLGIPGIYYFHQKKLKTIESIESAEDILKLYKRSFLIKIAITEGLLFIAGILYLFQGTVNFLIIMVISLVYLLMNTPNIPNLSSELNLNKEDEEKQEAEQEENKN